MKINDTVADTTRAAHDVGLAASRPSTCRALRRSFSANGRSPLWIGSGVVTTAALADQLRRRLG